MGRRIAITASYILALISVNIGITVTMHYSGSPHAVLVSVISFLFLENIIRKPAPPPKPQETP